MTTRTPTTCLGIVATFIAVSHFAQGAAQDTVHVQPGLWVSMSRFWLNGVEASGQSAAPDRATRRAIDQARAQMAPKQRESIDHALAQHKGADVDVDCIAEAESDINPRDLLRRALSSARAMPWVCNFTKVETTSTDFSFDFHCTTPAGARAEGHVQGVIHELSYTYTVEGQMPAVLNEQGRPITPQNAIKSQQSGMWIAAQCPAELKTTDKKSGSAEEE